MLCIAGIVGGGSGDVLGGSPVLCADPRGLYDGSDDAHHAAHAARLSPRLCAEEPNQHRLEGAAQLVHPDR